jgi:hypothetical protein
MTHSNIGGMFGFHHFRFAKTKKSIFCVFSELFLLSDIRFICLTLMVSSSVPALNCNCINTELTLISISPAQAQLPGMEVKYMKINKKYFITKIGLVHQISPKYLNCQVHKPKIPQLLDDLPGRQPQC